MTLLLMQIAPAKHLLKGKTPYNPRLRSRQCRGCAFDRHETLARKLAFGKPRFLSAQIAV
jgi:hypothetical protein